MGISYKEVVENHLLSRDVMECIPPECECGSPIEFTDSLRQIYCSNAKCLYKVAARLEAMAELMQADGWGESTCVTVCREFGIISPYQVFLLEGRVKEGATSATSAFEKKVMSICATERRKVEIWEVVKLAGIPSIGTIAYKIFDGYDSLTDAFSDIERGQVPFIAEKLGLKNSENSVMAVTIYNTLIAYKTELLFGEQQFEIHKPVGQTVYFAITGGVYGFRNKSEYINHINTRYAGKINAMLMTNATSQVDILIADGDTSSNKYRTAIKINQKHIEKSIGLGLFSLSDVGKFLNATDLHPVGEKIFVTNSEEALERLDKVFNK